MELLIVVLLIVLNGVLSMSEIAIVSARRARLDEWLKAGDRKARAALELMAHPTQFFSTVQIGITLVGVLTGALGQAAIADDLSAYFARFPLLAPYSQALAFALVVIVLTYLSLIIGELVPKRLGLQSPERIARLVALPMQALSRLTHPAVRLLSLSTDGILKLFRVPTTAETPVTEEEIKALIEEGTRSGVFVQAERDLLRNVIRLADRPMEMLMQPRSEIVWLDLDDPLEQNKRKMIESPHSRFPVARGSLDNILGIIEAKDLVARSLTGAPLNLEAAMRPALHVPETLSSLRLLDMFKQTPDAVAIIVDEYGETKGLITLTDILEAIVGGLPSAGEIAEPSIVQREDGSFLLDGMLAVDEFKELFNLPKLPAEEEGDYETLGGFVLTQLGRIPAIADHFEWNDLRFEIIDMDGNRIDRVLVERLHRDGETDQPQTP